jgi:hypothetical protein
MVVSFVLFFKNYRTSANVWTAFSKRTIYVFILTIRGWATVWATFSQANMVTLHADKWPKLNSVTGLLVQNPLNFVEKSAQNGALLKKDFYPTDLL